MTNADKFKNIFGLYATELWSMPEKDFLKWLNSEAMNCSEFPNNSDVVDRQKAKNAICNACGKIDCDEMDTCEKLDIPSEGSKLLQPWEVLVAQAVLSQPAAPRRGKWIVDRYGIVICSECRKPRRDNRIDHIGWCNGCGAKMEVTT